MPVGRRDRGRILGVCHEMHPAVTSRAAEDGVVVATPTVDGPIDSPVGPESVRGYPWNDLDYEVGSIGYVVQEFFISGTARDGVGVHRKRP